MVARQSNEEGVDFETMDADLGEVALPKLTLRDQLDGWGIACLERQAKGVAVSQTQEAVAARGEEISARSSKAFVDRGVSGRVGSTPVGTLNPLSLRSEPESEYDADRRPKLLAGCTANANRKCGAAIP